MGRNATTITLSKAERRQLERISRSRTASVGGIERARIVLLADAGLINHGIARQLGLCRSTVALWRNRFAVNRLDGLNEQRRPGRPRVYAEAARTRVIDIASTLPPPDSKPWTVRRLAIEAGVGRDTVHRILRQEQAHRTTIDRKATVLRESFVFSHLGADHLAELSMSARELELKAGEFLFLTGDRPEYCHLIGSGIVKVIKHSPSGKDFIMAVVGPGEILGSMLVFSQECYSSSCQAVVDATVLAISKTELLSFLQKHPEPSLNILGRILNVALKNHQRATTRLAEWASEKADFRLSNALLTLSLEFGSTIPLTRRELAEIAGTTAETATRFVSQLRERGVVESLRGKVVVLQRDKLELFKGILSSS